LKSSNIRYFLLCVLFLPLIFSCSNNYYNRFGGYPLKREEFAVKEAEADIKLQVSYRSPYQNGKADSTNLNIIVKLVIPKEEMKRLRIEKLTLAASDTSYLNTYYNPAVYDQFGKYPLRSEWSQNDEETAKSSSDQLCLFTVSRQTPQYLLTVYYQLRQPDNTWLMKQQSFPIDISGVKIKFKREQKEEIYE